MPARAVVRCSFASDRRWSMSLGLSRECPAMSCRSEGGETQKRSPMEMKTHGAIDRFRTSSAVFDGRTFKPPKQVRTKTHADH